MHALFTRIGALQILGALVLLIRTKAGALVLGPGGVGVVSIVDQFVQLVLQLAAFAIPFAAVKVLSKAHSEGAESFRAAYAGLLRLLLILGFSGAVLGIALVYFRPQWVNAPLATYTPLVAIGLAALPALILHGFFRNVPAAAMQPTISAVWDVITAAVMTVAVIAGMLWFKERGYFVGVLVGAVVVSVGYYAYLARRFGLTVNGQLASARGLLKANPTFVELSLISYAVAFISPLALLIVRGAVLERFGEASAGMLQAAIGISLAINLILNPLNGLLLTPRVNRALAESEKHRETASFQRRLLLPIAIVAVPPILFPDVAVIALYSGEFVDAAPALYWFVMGQAMMQIQGIYTALMIGLDRLKAYGIVVVLGTAMYAALAVLLVPHLGLTGAGIASFASACLLALGTFGYLRIRDRFAIGREAGFGTLLLFAGLGLAGAAIGAQSSLILPNLIVKTLICLLAIGIMVPISLDRDERHALATRLGAVFRRG